MNYETGLSAADDRAIRFTGNWREYLPIAATNALLIIVTLGLYRFWATARQRRYLWSHTHVIDDTLEWSGTGKEMFVGFLIVVAVLLPFFLFIQFLFPAMVARGQNGAAGVVLALFYVGIVYLGGLARFRALRYRLSRSWWHGIRGGSNDPGWGYARSYIGRYGLTALTLWIVFPWATTGLWNRRWNAMSFGPLPFHADLDATGLKRRWAALYALPFVGMLLALLGGVGAAIGGNLEGGPGAGLAFALFGVLLLIYIGIPLITLAFFAKFYRKAASATTLGELSFSFDARTRDWLKLFLGNIALAVVTLGFGLTYWGYRNWSFFVRHACLHGTVDLATLTQSTASAPGEAEGFSDMFDVGAI
jgi:uncharacterized membrane protein YjgN (DUF898 family)